MSVQNKISVESKCAIMGVKLMRYIQSEIKKSLNSGNLRDATVWFEQMKHYRQAVIAGL